MKTEQLYELVPVVGSGEYFCEHGDCAVRQTDEDKDDILYYGVDNGMFCKEHLPLHVEPVNI